MIANQRAHTPRAASGLLPTILWLSLATGAPSARAEPAPAALSTAATAASLPTTQPSLPTTQPSISKSHATAAGGEASTRAHIVFTSDLFGRFAWPGCDRRARHRAELAQLITGVQTLVLQSKLDGAGRPLVLAGGSTLRLDVMGAQVYGQDGEPSRRLTKLIKRVGFDAVSVGPHDWGARPSTLSRYGSLMRLAGVSLLSGNVTCSDPLDRRCRSLGGAGDQPYRLVERGGLRIGVLSVVRADMTTRMLARSRQGLLVSDPVAWSRAIIRRLRHDKIVDFVVVLANMNTEGDAPLPVLGYVRQLGPDAPDLVVANAMYESGQGAFVEQVRRGKTLIVGTDRFGQHVGDVTVDYRRVPQGIEIEHVNVRHHPTSDFEGSTADVAALDGLMEGMCRVLARPLGRARLARPTSHGDFLNLVMQVMRHRAKAEVALLDGYSLADTSFPMSGRLTWEKVLRAVRTDTTVGWISVVGERLKQLLQPYIGADNASLGVLGITRKGSNWFVNGRPLLLGQRYRVATTAFVAEGGENLLALNGQEPFHDGGMALRQLLGQFLQARGRYPDHRSTIEPDTALVDLQDHWLLSGAVDLGLSFSNVAISNTGTAGNRYSLPLLQRDPLTSLSTELKTYGEASTRNHRLDSELHLQYGQTCTAGFANCAESNDQITGALTYLWRRLRNAVGGQRWYVPEPFVEGRINTEFTPGGAFERCLDEGVDLDDCPEDRKVTETFHYMDISGVAGLAVSPHPLLLLKAGALLRGEVLAPEQRNPDIPFGPGLYLSYRLRRLSFFASSDHPLQLESQLDYYLTDLGGRGGSELNWQTKVFFALTRRFNLTASHRLYLFGTVDDQLSLANDISLGISLLFDGRRQTF